MCSSKAREYSRSASNSDWSLRTRPSSRSTSTLIFWRSIGELLAAATLARVGIGGLGEAVWAGCAAAGAGASASPGTVAAAAAWNAAACRAGDAADPVGAAGRALVGGMAQVAGATGGALEDCGVNGAVTADCRITFAGTRCALGACAIGDWKMLLSVAEAFAATAAAV